MRRHLDCTASSLEVCTKLCGFREWAGLRKKRRKESIGGALWAAAARQVDRFRNTGSGINTAKTMIQL